MNVTDLKERSYVPYSSQPGAAIVQSTQGHYFPGVRVENISYPLTISAVQNALFCCMSEDEKPAALFAENINRKNTNLSFWKNEFGLQMGNLSSLENVSFHAVFQNIGEDKITQKLQKLLENPWVKESNFPVAALLETESGYVTGKNIELSRWNRGLCAERVALAKAISYGAVGFKALHITTRYGEFNSPCGACRQVIIEHMPHQPVYFHEHDGSSAKYFSSDLLPQSFHSTKLHDKNK